MAKKKQNGRLFVIITVVATVVLVPVSYMILSAMGERAGVEFSPDDFTMRSFNYCRLPLVGWTKRGIEYRNFPNDSAETLIADDWVRASGRTPKRWHLVSESGSTTASSGRKTSVECDARFLTKYFDFVSSEGENYIMKWTDDHPKAGKVFWPLIAELARDDLYLPVPDIMEFALEYPKMDDPDQFNAELKQLVADAWFEAAKSDQLNNRHQSATRRFDVAIRIGGGHLRAQQAKVKSQAAVSDGKDQSP